MIRTVERERFGGKEMYVEVYKGHRGLRPSRVVSIEDEDGVPCVTTDAQHQRWRRHFNIVLNIRGQDQVCG